MRCEMWHVLCCLPFCSMGELELYLKSSIPCMWIDKTLRVLHMPKLFVLPITNQSFSFLSEVNGRITFPYHQMWLPNPFFLQVKAYVTLCNVYNSNILGSLEPVHYTIPGFNFYTHFENKHWEIFVTFWIHCWFIFVLSVSMKGENSHL